MRAAGPMVVLVAGLASASCGQRVLLGGTEGPPPTPDPLCLDAPCGATCTIDTCATHAGDVCTLMVGYCDPRTGACIEVPPTCPVPPPLPCLEQPCGAPCDPGCPDAEVGCDPTPGPTMCDGMGQCVLGPLGCPCTEPGCIIDPQCLEQPCGAQCNPCDPMDPACPPPPVPFACDFSGACLPATDTACPVPFDPCSMKVCGDPCQLCPPADPTCVEPPGPKTCDEMGQCIPGMLGCADPGNP